LAAKEVVVVDDGYGAKDAIAAGAVIDFGPPIPAVWHVGLCLRFGGCAVAAQEERCASGTEGDDVGCCDLGGAGSAVGHVMVSRNG
jgi:hypothetical protein